MLRSFSIWRTGFRKCCCGGYRRSIEFPLETAGRRNVRCPRFAPKLFGDNLGSNIIRIRRLFDVSRPTNLYLER
jgi:hypothetical protein